MKKKYASLISVLILTISTNCWGQVTTREIKYPELKGENIILKVDDNNNANLMYYEWEGESYFLYTRHTQLGFSYSPLIFPLPTPYAIPWGTIRYRINDMKLIGNKCFYCGIKYTPVGEEHIASGDRNIIYDSIGFVGWIDTRITYIFSDFYTVDVKNTADLRRLAIKQTPNDTLVAIIGTSSDSHLPCLVTLLKNGASDYYQIHKIINPSEQLMDVVFTEEMLVTVSKFLNEHRSFGLRGASYNDLFVYPPFSTDYQVNHKINTPNRSNHMVESNYLIGTCYYFVYGDNCIMDPPPEIHYDGSDEIRSDRYFLNWTKFRLTAETTTTDTVCVHEY